MTNQQLFLIIIALLAVIPSGVVFVVLWTRQLDQNTRINAALGGKDDINRIEQSQKDLDLKIAKHDTAIVGLQESFANLVNKVNSRQRTERIQASRDKEQEEPDKVPEGYEQQNMFPPVFPLDQRKQNNGGENKRMVLRVKNY
jgi:Skp family chaperone for outer membrane proteins